MADISKEDLKKEIQDILKDADLDNTSAKKVLFSLRQNKLKLTKFHFLGEAAATREAGLRPGRA